MQAARKAASIGRNTRRPAKQHDHKNHEAGRHFTKIMKQISVQNCIKMAGLKRGLIFNAMEAVNIVANSM